MASHKCSKLQIGLLIFFFMTCTLIMELHAGIQLLDDFEGNWSSCWHTDYGTWEVGAPASGPGSAYSPTNCVATILSGNYGNYIDSSFIRHCPFEVPEASENPRLRFRHWYYFTINDNDYGEVRIRVAGTTNWEVIATYQNWSGGVWTQPFLDLSDYAGQLVEIAFYFHSDNSYAEPGWYIDDISLETGERPFVSPEGWEAGFQDWYADYGTWEVGTPTSGPGNAHSGFQCMATRLDSNYYNYCDSRLISPSFTVPAASETPRLRFWHWYYFRISDDDYGEVQIRVAGTENWEVIERYRNWSGGVWTQPFLDLSDYAGQLVEIAFYFHSDSSYETPGWYIDDIFLETGERPFVSPESWEAGFQDWHADYGTWEVGTPTTGPGNAHKGLQCMATRLDSNYYNYCDSRLISPPFKICSNGSFPVLRFWHWYKFYINDDDYGKVQIRVVGETDWDTLATYSNTSGGIWTQPYISLSAYVGDTVEIAFYFHSDDSYATPGWYIDDIELQNISPQITNIDYTRYIPSCSSSIVLSALDPCGVGLTYKYLPQDGGLINGTGPQVDFEPDEIRNPPHHIMVSILSDLTNISSPSTTLRIYTTALYDTEKDGDVDGSDLHPFTTNFTEENIERFAEEFGMIACE